MLPLLFAAFLLGQSADAVKLSPDSPAINAGANLGPPYNSILDQLGLDAPFDQSSSGWMIGAFGVAPGFVITGSEISGVITQ